MIDEEAEIMAKMADEICQEIDNDRIKVIQDWISIVGEDTYNVDKVQTFCDKQGVRFIRPSKLQLFLAKLFDTGIRVR